MSRTKHHTKKFRMALHWGKRELKWERERGMKSRRELRDELKYKLSDGKEAEG